MHCKCCTADWMARAGQHAKESDWMKYIDRIQENSNFKALIGKKRTDR